MGNATPPTPQVPQMAQQTASNAMDKFKQPASSPQSIAQKMASAQANSSNFSGFDYSGSGMSLKEQTMNRMADIAAHKGDKDGVSHIVNKLDAMRK